MFSFKVAVVAVLALALSVVANPVAVRTGQCDTGDLHCCESTDNSPGLVGDLLGLIGLNCTPIVSVIGGDTSCTRQTVCCSDNVFKGLIAIGCTPISINL